MNLDRTESDINDITAKLKEKKERLKALTNIQASLIKRSKAKKDGRRIPASCSNPIESYKDEKWYITCFGKTVSVYDNDYLFEIRYLRPKIRQLSGVIKSLISRKNRLEHKLSRMKEDKQTKSY